MLMMIYTTAFLFAFGVLSMMLRVLNSHSYIFAITTFSTALISATFFAPTLATPLITALSIFYGTINLYTFILYALDKRASIKNTWRIRERQLHLFMFAGGVIGAIAGQYIFRHKTQKLSFRIIFWILLLCQVLIIAWLVYDKWL